MTEKTVKKKQKTQKPLKKHVLKNQIPVKKKAPFLKKKNLGQKKNSLKKKRTHLKSN